MTSSTITRTRNSRTGPIPAPARPILKAQHPEYELFTADSTHYNAGVACADCHMPYIRDGAMKYSSHDIHSPLLDPQAPAGNAIRT